MSDSLLGRRTVLSLDLTIGTVETHAQVLSSTMAHTHGWGRGCQARSTVGISNRLQWFGLFFTFWGMTTHPWHPKGPRISKLAKKIFNLIHGLRKFLAKTGKCVFSFWFQSLILGPPFDRSLLFFQHVSCMRSLIHIQKFWFLSQKL
jgi:hypothetical protein